MTAWPDYEVDKPVVGNSDSEGCYRGRKGVVVAKHDPTGFGMKHVDVRWEDTGEVTPIRTIHLDPGDLKYRHIYVAGSRHDIHRVRRVQASLIEIGCAITYDWTIRCEHWAGQDRALPIPLACQTAEEERIGVNNADALVLVWNDEHQGVGRIIETGMAMAAKKPIIVLGEPYPVVFWHLPEVQIVQDRTSLLEAVQQ